jgi:hypothetical protein
MASLKNQVVNALKCIDGNGKKKREVRAANKEKTGPPLAHATSYYINIRRGIVGFTEHAKQTTGVKNIWELTQDHTDSYLDHLQQKGSSIGYLIDIESYLAKFQTAAILFCKMIGKEPPYFFSKRRFSSREREKPKNRSYTSEEIETLARAMSPDVRKAMEMAVNPD